MNEQSNKLRDLIHCGIFAAITAVLAQLEIPLPLVPISGQTLAVGLAATILGSRKGALAMLCYVLLGTVGLPVFAGATGGVHILFECNRWLHFRFYYYCIYYRLLFRKNVLHSRSRHDCQYFSSHTCINSRYDLVKICSLPTMGWSDRSRCDSIHHPWDNQSLSS